MTEFRHTTVYREPGVFAGWPANHGLWQRDGRILVGFETGAMDVQGGFHAIDRRSPVRVMIADTDDGGEEWDCWEAIGKLELRDNRLGITQQDTDAAEKDCEYSYVGGSPGEFHRGLFKARMLDINRGQSYWNISYDRGLSWQGPYAFPDIIYDQPIVGRVGFSARTSYLTYANDPKRCLAFMSASKSSDNREGQPFCIETRSGGYTWEFVSWIDDVPKHCFGIMPSVVRLQNGSVICAVRWRERDFEHKYGTEDDPFEAGIVVYRSDDECRMWQMISVPVKGLMRSGNPPDLVQLQDGTLILVYGWRGAIRGSQTAGRDLKYGILYQVSIDEGKTWSEPCPIRQGAGCADMGYTRSAVRQDGKIVSAYYWNDSRDSERYIAATIWEPN